MSFRDRSLLHLNKLDQFAAWAKARGYERETTKGEYEVLRLRRPGQPPLIYYNRDRGDHATSWGDGLKLVGEWMRLVVRAGNQRIEIRGLSREEKRRQKIEARRDRAQLIDRESLSRWVDDGGAP